LVVVFDISSQPLIYWIADFLDGLPRVAPDVNLILLELLHLLLHLAHLLAHRHDFLTGGQFDHLRALDTLAKLLILLLLILEVLVKALLLNLHVILFFLHVLDGYLDMVRLASDLLDVSLDLDFERAWLQIVTELFICLHLVTMSSLDVFNEFDFFLQGRLDP